MRVVVLSRTPSWYPWRNDRCLRQLAEQGHAVVAVVVEKASSRAFLFELIAKFGPRVFVRKAIEKLGRLFSSGGTGDKATGSATEGPAVRTEILKVAAHNGDECISALEARRPDLIVLRGTGIIRKRVLAVPRIGTLNAHYGSLPCWRGMDVTEWSVLHGANPAVTIHFVDTGVDTGSVLATEELQLDAADTLGSLADKSAALAARMLASVATGLEEGSLEPRPQDESAGRQYYAMHPRVRALAERTLQLRLGCRGATPAAGRVTP